MKNFRINEAHRGQVKDENSGVMIYQSGMDLQGGTYRYDTGDLFCHIKYDIEIHGKKPDGSDRLVLKFEIPMPTIWWRKTDDAKGKPFYGRANGRAFHGQSLTQSEVAIVVEDVDAALRVLGEDFYWDGCERPALPRADGAAQSSQ